MKWGYKTQNAQARSLIWCVHCPSGDSKYAFFNILAYTLSSGLLGITKKITSSLGRRRRRTSLPACRQAGRFVRGLKRPRFAMLAMTGASIFVSLFFLAGCGEPTLLLSANPPSYDFGNIPKNGGTVSTVFVLKNLGQEPITINRVSTSCGCTIAEMDQSPIPAGGDRILTVAYDPMVHPEEFGPIQRAVYIQNSDTNFPELIIDILGNVVGEGKAP